MTEPYILGEVVYAMIIGGSLSGIIIGLLLWSLRVK